MSYIADAIVAVLLIMGGCNALSPSAQYTCLRLVCDGIIDDDRTLATVALLSRQGRDVTRDRLHVLARVFNPVLDDDQLVANLDVLVQDGSATPELRSLLQADANASYLARRLYRLRFRTASWAKPTLRFVVEECGGTAVAEFMVGVAVCDFMEALEDSDSDDESVTDFAIREQLLSFLLPYCSAVSAASFPEGVKQVGDLCLEPDNESRACAAYFTRPHKVRAYLLRNPDLVRHNPSLSMALMRCGVRLCLGDVLQVVQPQATELYSMLPYLEDLPDGIRFRFSSLMLHYNVEVIAECFRSRNFRYAFQREDQYDYILSACRRAINAARCEELRFMVTLPGSRCWITEPIDDAGSSLLQYAETHGRSDAVAVLRSVSAS